MILTCDITKKPSGKYPRYDNGKRLYAVNYYPNRSIIVIFILTHCSVRTEGVKSFCMAPTTELGKEAIISCHFGDDISKTQQDVIVYIYKDTGKKPVVQYAWFNGKHTILQENGYECDETISEYLVVRIPHTTREHAAQYSCIVAPSEKEEVIPCTLKLLRDDRTITQAEHVRSVHQSDAEIMFSSSTLLYSEVQSSSNKERGNQESEEDVPWETPVIIALSFIFGILLTVLILLSVFIAKKYNFFAESWIFNCIHAKKPPHGATAPVNDVEMPLNEGGN